jgi:hypothetical protein
MSRGHPTWNERPTLSSALITAVQQSEAEGSKVTYSASIDAKRTLTVTQTSRPQQFSLN